MSGASGVGGAGGGGNDLIQLLKEQELTEGKQAQGASDPSVDDKKAAEEAAAAAAAQQALINAPPNDTVVKGTSDAGKTGPIEGSGNKASAPGDANEPFLNDANTDLPPKDAADVSANVMNEVGAAFDNMTRAIDMEYAKLIRDCKNNIEELEQKIKEFTQKIKELKAQADKIMKIADKMEKLLPEIMAYVGTDRSTMCNDAQEHSAANKEFADLITKKVSEATGGEVQLDPDMMMNISECIMRGGPGATALAMTLCMQICELGADREINANKGQKLEGDPEANNEVEDANDPTDAKNVQNEETLTVGDPRTDPAAREALTGIEAGSDADTFKDGDDPLSPTNLGVSEGDGAKATGTVDPLDPTAEVVDTKPLTDAEAFVAKLENLSEFAAKYAAAEPYMTIWGFNFGETQEFNEANAALINALFPGMATGPNGYKIGSDFKGGQNADGKGGVKVEGFSVSADQLALASMLPGKMAGAYLGAVIKAQAADKIAAIDKAIDALMKEIQAAKKEIKSLQAEIGELEKKRDKEKEVVQKEKQKALEECSKIVKEMQGGSIENQKALLTNLNDAVSEIFNQTIQQVMAIAKGEDGLTAKGSGAIR